MNEVRQSDVEVRRLVGAAAAEVDEQADGQVSQSHQVLVHAGAVERRFAHQHVGGELHPSAAELVFGFAPRAEARQHLRDIQGVVGGDALDALQTVAGPHSGIAARAVGSHLQGLYAARAIDPNHTIVGKPEIILLMKVNNGGYTCG